MSAAVCAVRRELCCRSCHSCRIHQSSIRRPDSVLGDVILIRELAELVLMVLMHAAQVLERVLAELRQPEQAVWFAVPAFLVWRPLLVLLVLLVFSLVADLVSLRAVEVPVPERTVVAEAAQVRADQRRAVRHSADRRA